MTSGAPSPPGLAEAVQEQTEGNPFFVGEVVRLLASEGKLTGGGSVAELQIPQGVREVVGRRLDRLSDETNEALRVAAVIGRDFDEELVGRVAEAAAGGADEGRQGGDRRAARHRSGRRALLLRPRAGPRHALRGAQPAEALGAPRAHRPRDRGDLRRQRRGAPRRARPSLPRGGPARRPRQGDRLRPARRRPGHGAARLRGRRRRLRAGPRGARADGRARRGAALQPPALARRAPRPSPPGWRMRARRSSGRPSRPAGWTTPTASSAPPSASR